MVKSEPRTECQETVPNKNIQKLSEGGIPGAYRRQLLRIKSELASVVQFHRTFTYTSHIQAGSL